MLNGVDNVLEFDANLIIDITISVTRHREAHRSKYREETLESTCFTIKPFQFSRGRLQHANFKPQALKRIQYNLKKRDVTISLNTTPKTMVAEMPAKDPLIAWIRSRDSHILTVDRYTFIADERFQAWHEPSTETWTLQVKYVQERDEGRYECQVSTEPKMSHFVYFTVVTPLVHIAGGPDMYVKSGSTVTLKCFISAALKLPEYIFWYQEKERVIEEDREGGRQIYVERIAGDTTIGTLLIPRASPRDQGTYSCSPASLPSASVTLHVLNGEHPAAMHHGKGVKGHCPSLTYSDVTAKFYVIPGHRILLNPDAVSVMVPQIVLVSDNIAGTR
ncbi:uncharacterized protein LOC134786170 [Penaeus indicus]|uniref:uncharacterized protein LOC134786170 n=1 Tax=Penaeus indicus TaxID=29960 RepID=UPI00300C64EA